MKKKLLVTASTFPRWKGDTEPRFILDLSKALQKYFDVTVLVPSAPGAKEHEDLEGIEVVRYHYFPIHKWETLCYPGAIVPRIKEKKIRVFLVPFLFLGLYIKLFKILPQYDIVHAHWLIPQGIVQSFFKKPYIVTGHGGDVMSLNKGIFKYLKRRCLNNAKKITVVSDALQKQVTKLCPNTESSVISMGCDITKFGRRFRQENYFSQGNEKIILFVGRLVEVKGVSYLIEAMKNIDAKLIIVGDGPLKESLQRQAESIKNKVEFLGAKSHTELARIYASSDIFVAPSVTTKDGSKEGLGLVLLEAMASGLPVVGSESGGIPEIIQDGYNGFLVEEKSVEQLTKKIRCLIDSEELCVKLAENGLKTAKERDYRTIAKKYKDVLENEREYNAID